MCSAPKCQMRFTHANRHCPEHPYDTLKRCDDFVIQAVTEQNHEVIKWLEKYKMEKEDRTPTRKTPKRTKHLCDTTNHHLQSNEKNQENFNHGMSENENEFPVTPSNPYKSRKGLMVELDMNAGLGASPLAGNRMKPTPKVIQWQEPLSQEEDSADEFEMPSARSTFNPKKRWLREAWQDDLARPLEPYVSNMAQLVEQSKSIVHSDNETKLPPPLPPPLPPLQHQTTGSIFSLSPYSSSLSIPALSNASSNYHIDPNQMRPTVLMVANKDKTMPLLDLNSTLSPPTTNNSENNLSIATTSTSSSSISLASSPSSYDNVILPQTPILRNNTNECFSTNGSIIVANDASNSFTDLIPLEESPSQSTSSGSSSCGADSRNGASGACGTRNRKWMGALALMQLATDDNITIRTVEEQSDELNTSIVHHSSYTEL